jgi:hypothetical protein
MPPLLALAFFGNATKIEMILIEQHILDTNSVKQLSEAATDV